MEYNLICSPKLSLLSLHIPMNSPFKFILIRRDIMPGKIVEERNECMNENWKTAKDSKEMIIFKYR